MRKIDWNKALSKDDIAWIRQAGFMSAEQIARHQEQHQAEAPEVKVPEDQTTKRALDPAARTGDSVDTGTGPRQVDPTGGPADDEDEGDDYDQWKVPELEAEVSARNAIPDTSSVTVEGTGANGKVTKADLVKGLRLWDRENPAALSED